MLTQPDNVLFGYGGKSLDDMKYFVLVPEGMAARDWSHKINTIDFAPFIDAVQQANYFADEGNLIFLDRKLEFIRSSNHAYKSINIGLRGIDDYCRYMMQSGIENFVSKGVQMTSDEIRVTQKYDIIV